MDAMENEQGVLTQSYPLPAISPSVHGTRPADQPGADPDACVTARNAGGIVRAIESEPPRTMRSRFLDVFEDWGSEEEDGEGEDD